MPCTNLGNMAEATLRVARPVMRALLAMLALPVTRVHPVNSLPDAEMVKAAKGAKVVKAAREVKARRAKLVLGHSLRQIAR